MKPHILVSPFKVTCTHSKNEIVALLRLDDLNELLRIQGLENYFDQNNSMSYDGCWESLLNRLWRNCECWKKSYPVLGITEFGITELLMNTHHYFRYFHVTFENDERLIAAFGPSNTQGHEFDFFVSASNTTTAVKVMMILETLLCS